MGSGCSRCCGKVQDWCRDSCGCCPCDCCKTRKIEVKLKQTVEHKIEKKIIPYGYGKIRAGVRTADNANTTPVLEVHTWKKSATQKIMNEAAMTQRVALGGIQTQRDTADRHLGPSRGAEQHSLELEEEVLVIPIESIILAKYSTVVKKGHTEHKNVRLKTPPPTVELTNCQKIGRWCNTTFCCCCNDCKLKVHIGPEPIMTTISDEEAERTILVTIEYIRYSNIDTPSHVRVLGTTDQLAFYKDRLHVDTLQFYLVDNTDLEKTDFDLKRMQASTLCRLVTHFKSMTGLYPDEPALQLIIGKPDSLSIGDPPQETIRSLISRGTINNSLKFTTVPELTDV